MAAITAKDVAALRERTGVGMMDCKKALVEVDGDMENAITLLRERGLATQAKKAGRIAAEGLVIAKVNADNSVGVVLEVNSETDFVAKNDEFKGFVEDVAETIISSNPADLDALKATKIHGHDVTVEERLQEIFLKIRENMQIRRFERREGILIPYVHGDGKIAVLVNIAADAKNDIVLSCGKDVALQIAALNPAYLNRETVPSNVIEDEKVIIKSQMAEDPKMAGKPEQVISKIVDGKVSKYYSENCLLEQAFVKDDSMNVGKYIESVAKAAGISVAVTDFLRYEKGEGIQKREDNFADEVANMIK